jgi:hypothetical protein
MRKKKLPEHTVVSFITRFFTTLNAQTNKRADTKHLKMIRNSLPAPMMRTRPPVQRDRRQKLSTTMKEPALPRVRTEEAVSVELDTFEEMSGSKEFLNQPLSRTPTPHLSADEEEEIYTEGMRALLLALEASAEDTSRQPSRIVSPDQHLSPRSSDGARHRSVRKSPRSGVRRKKRTRRHVRNNSRSSIGSLPRIPEFDEGETNDSSFAAEDNNESLIPSPLVRHGGDMLQSPTLDCTGDDDDGSQSLNAKVYFKPSEEDSLALPHTLFQNASTQLRSPSTYSTYTHSSEYTDDDSFSTAFSFLTTSIGSTTTATASQAFTQIDQGDHEEDDFLPPCHSLLWFIGEET